jgi:GAF domain-containing protein
VKAAREAERVQALLDVSQHTSAARSVEELLRSTCDSAVAFLRVPRVEIFLWDPDAQLSAGRLPDRVDCAVAENR